MATKSITFKTSFIKVFRDGAAQNLAKNSSVNAPTQIPSSVKNSILYFEPHAMSGQGTVSVTVPTTLAKIKIPAVYKIILPRKLCCGYSKTYHTFSCTEPLEFAW